MKIVVAGDYHSHIYEEAFAKAWLDQGHDVKTFAWWQYFKGYQYDRETRKNPLLKLYYKFQNKFLIGPAFHRLNEDLLKLVNEYRPDLLFIYRGTHVTPKTIKKIRASGTIVFGYNNDDPFGKNYASYIWRHFKASIQHYHHLFIYREKNAADLTTIGYKNFSLLRSYYIRENNFPMPDASDARFNCDVLFAGHFEDDGRDDLLVSLIKQGKNVKIFGDTFSWVMSKHYRFITEKVGAIYQLNKQDYNLAINCAKICLVFLSKRNNDSYTRRCFEIPAARKFMLSEYSSDIASLFVENKEVVFFRSAAEFEEKINYYLQHPDQREAIATAGHERLLRDRHEVHDRVKQVLDVYHTLKHEENTRT